MRKNNELSQTGDRLALWGQFAYLFKSSGIINTTKLTWQA